MGIFSFLTGKKEEDVVEEAPSAPPAAPAAVPAPPVPEADGWGSGTAGFHNTPDGGSSFTPPDAWDTAALTAPPPPPTGDAPQMGALDPEQTAALQPKIVDAIKTVYDPEIPVDIYELGLIYEIIVDAEKRVLVKMTLTSPACPSAQQIPSEVRYKIKALPEVTDAWVEIVWEPPWSKERMSEAAKLTLGFF